MKLGSSKNAIGLMLYLVFATTFSFADARSAHDDSPDESAVRAIPQRMAEGWNKGSGEAFAAHFADDADYVVVNGNHIKGRKAIASGHQQIFDSFYKGTRLWIQVKSVRFLKPDVALMHSVSRVLKPGESEASATPAAIQSFLVSKHGGTWLIDSFHNTPIQPQAAAPPK